MEQIEKTGSESFDTLAEYFEAAGHTKRKRLSRVLYELTEDKKLILDEAGFYSPYRKNTQTPSPVHPKTALKPSHPVKPRIEREADSPLVDLDHIIQKYKLRNGFPPKVVKESLELPVVISEDEITRRKDYRNAVVFTIDGIDAKDLDDAVSVERKGNGFVLAVHIADVSHFVPKGSKLDQEALKRANSFYFVNRVLPMFPEKLSNGICSLNPNEDRLTLSAIMEIDRSGNVRSADFKKTVIHSKHRLNYDLVQEYFDGKKKPEDPALEESLKIAQELFQILRKRRIEGGAIDFDFHEQKCVLDDNGEPLNFYLKERQDSERLIEEFMLAANQAVATYLSSQKNKWGEAIYRTHPEPDPMKMSNFIRIANQFGHRVKSEGEEIPSPFELQRVLEEVKEKPQAELVNQTLLRSMQQARYQVENIGHYGLGFEFYTHFTSPIRRYADLIVHRLISQTIDGKREHSLYTPEELDSISTHISSQERIAMETEREFTKIKGVRFMVGYVGKSFPGVVTGVTSFGIFIQIKKFGIEGLARYADFEDDYYEFDADHYRAVGKHTFKTYTMGDPMNVMVVRADPKKGFLDLVPVDENGEAPRKAFKPRKPHYPPKSGHRGSSHPRKRH